MVKPIILQEEPISTTQLKKELAAIKKRDEEVGFRTNRTIEYLNHFSVLSDKKSAELAKAIESMKVTRIKEIHINKICDLQPTTPEELKTILQGYNITLTKDAMKKITDKVKEIV